MQILVTGATGLLGRHLLSSLLERGDTVRALVLPAENAVWLEERNVAIYRGDVRKQDTLVEPMRGVDKVFHLAGMMGVWRPMRDYYSVNVEGTRYVCQAALGAGVSRLVHVSSWNVYGIGLRQPANEDLPLAPFPEPYSLTKAEGEKVVRGFIDRHHLPAVIIRPDTFFGPGDRLHFGRMADRLSMGKGIVIGSGRNTLPFVYVSDVVQGLLLAADHAAAVGQAYNIGNDRPLTQEQFLGAMAQEIGARPPRVHVPFLPLYALAFAIEQLAVLGRSQHQPLITRLGAKLFGTNNLHTIDKACRELGYTPKVSIPEGIRIAGSWYRLQRSELTGVPEIQVGTPA